jgi:hypothetical protein
MGGGRTEPYVPLYYIGLAYYRMGDCGRAGVTWQLAKMGGEVLDHPALARAMREYVDACAAGKSGDVKLAEPDTSAGATNAPSGAASAANSPRVRNLLQGARSDLAAKRFARARQRAEEALRLGADQAQVDALLADVEDAEKAASAASAAAPPAETRSSTAGGSSDTERIAMEAFYALDYARTRQLLEPLDVQRALSPRGYLYLACSYAAEAVTGGRDVDAAMQRARATYQKALPNAKAFDADWKYISPRLRSLVEGKSNP